MMTKGRSYGKHWRASKPDAENGFTLIELLVAMMILGVVMAALAPALYGSMKAVSYTDQRSVAVGLAVSATEELRSVPYTEVGYNTKPSSCPASNAVVFSPAIANSPLDTLATSASPTISGTTYQLTRCITWVNASDGSSAAYKQSTVTVTWTDSLGIHSVQQQSALYPGGLGPVGQSQSTSTTLGTAGIAPSAPTNVSTDLNGAPGTINVNWTPPTTTAAVIQNYVVEYNTSGDFSTFTTSPSITTTTWNTGTLTGPYYFRVVSVAADGTQSVPSPVVTNTASSSTSSVCQVSSVVVNPSSGVIDGTGHLVNSTQLALTVTANAYCSNVSVGYTTDSSTVISAPVTPSGGSYTGVAGGSSTIWTAGIHRFDVYVNGTLYSPTNEQQVAFCQEKGNSGKC